MMPITLHRTAFAESDNVIGLCISAVETAASTLELPDTSNLPYFAHRSSGSLTNLNSHIMYKLAYTHTEVFVSNSLLLV